MQTLSEAIWALAPPGGIFNESVILNLFSSKSAGARKSLVRRAVVAGEVHTLKPGLYFLDESIRQGPPPHPYVIAALLYGPSYVSMESALAFHGLIPESVYQVASTTSKRSRDFDTPLGRFTFHRVPSHELYAGVRSEPLPSPSFEAPRQQRNATNWAFVAGPWRAIADLVYLRPSVRATDGLAFLRESLRMEDEDLLTLSRADFEETLATMRNRRVRDILQAISKELQP